MKPLESTIGSASISTTPRKVTNNDDDSDSDMKVAHDVNATTGRTDATNGDDKTTRYNKKMPFFCHKGDIEFSRYLATKRGEIASQNSKLPTRTTILFDLTTGLRDASSFEYNPRCIIITIIYALLCIPGLVSNNPFYMIPSLVISGLFYLSTSSTAVCLHCLGIENMYDKKRFESFGAYLLGISKHDTGEFTNKSGIVPRKVPWFIIGGGCFTMLGLLFAQLKFKDSSKVWTSMCNGEDYLADNVIENGGCLVRHSTYSLFFIYFSYAFGVSLLLLRYPSDDALEICDLAKKRLEKLFKASKGPLKIIEEMQQDRTFAIKTITWDNIFYLILSIVVSFSAMFTSDNEMFWDIGSSSAIFSYCIYIYTRIIVSFWWFRVIADLWNVDNLYQRDKIAMKALAGAIYITEINDLRMWYEMRQYYLNYQQPLGSQGRGWIPLISVLISGIVFVLYSFVQIVIIDGDYSFVYQDPDGCMSMWGIMILVFFMLRFVFSAVQTTNAQLAHIHTLNYEIVRLQALEHAMDRATKLLETESKKEQLDKMKQDKDKEIIAQPQLSQNINPSNKMQLDIIKEDKEIIVEAREGTQLIVRYLEKYDSPTTILGIPMTNAMLYAIGGYVSTVVVSIISYDWLTLANEYF